MQDRQHFDTVTLDNGITVYSHPMDVPFFSVHVLLPVGNVHSHDGNPGGRGGIAHFLEHLIFQRSARYKEKQSFERLLFLEGGNWNAATGPFDTDVYVDAPVRFQPVVLEGLLSHVFEPVFDAADIAVERGVVRNERNQRRYYPGSGEINKYLRTKWKYHQFFSREQLFGSDADLDSMDPAGLQTFHQTYRTRGIRVVVGGGHDLPSLCDQFARIRTKHLPLADRHEPMSWTRRAFHTQSFRDIEVPHYFLGGFVPGYELENEWAIDFILDLMSNYGHGPLYQWLRNEEGWTYGVGTGMSMHKDRIDWLIELPLNDNAPVERIRKELPQRMWEALGDRALVEREVKRQLYNRLYLYQTLGSRLRTAVEQLEDSGRIPTEAEYVALTKDMADTGRLRRVYEQYFAPDVTGEFLALPTEEERGGGN